ncbi:redoxin domain-containing protein [Synoicihabitans lomoniglobus]|uniref:Redoxin domain-containing protein n=1 Tax=Synoicihabitans lomoniglobus TaxID=2909285 RepID=A0AAF0CMF1_9BACT|nr:redoxin domain-containing protein [Opitutaceae bacterium LMO-M01]WED64023.1 redoxin domain-containing protein [Opitutaceae bacterium LMO-M01]
MMPRLIPSLLTLVALSAGLASAADDYPKPPPLGTPLPHFELPGIEGGTYEVKTYTPESFADAKLLCIVFTCNHCPTAQRYEERLKQLTTDYGPKGVAVIALNPNNAAAVRLDEMAYTDLTDSFEDMKVRAEHKSFNFPYLDDGETQEISRVFGPVATPHVFIYDQDRKLAFQGRIDDAELPQYIKHQDTRAALDELLAGKKVSTPTTRVFGCSVKWAEKAEGYNKIWAEQVKNEPVELKEAVAADFVALRENKDSGKLRLINVWATWCGPCVTEFPDLVDTNLTFRGRDFEMVTIAAEYPKMSAKALKFLKGQHASMQNYIFGDTDKYANIEAIDPEWNGALPHTLLVNEKGEVIYRQTGPVDFLELRRIIVPALDQITPWGGLDGN